MTSADAEKLAMEIVALHEDIEELAARLDGHRPSPETRALSRGAGTPVATDAGNGAGRGRRHTRGNMTTKLPIPSRATDDDVVGAIAETLREAHAAAVPGAFRIIVERLRQVYGTRLVDRALGQYERALRQERRRLERDYKRMERSLKRQAGVDVG